MEKNYQLINPAIIASNMMDNTAMIKQFIGLYLNQLPLDFAALTEAIDSNLHKAIEDRAHHIKPTMHYVGAQILKDKFQTLENAGKNQDDLPSIRHLYQSIAQEFELLLQELKSYLETL